MAAPLVLVVDDEAIVRETIVAALAYAGYAVAQSQCGQDALEAIRAGLKPSLILLDLMMPGLTGSGMLDELRKSGDVTPVILLTGHVDSVRNETRWQARGVMRKPVAVAALLDAVRLALQGSNPNAKALATP